ncbi:MAG: hypothetical protein VB045_00945, partial [Synergistaceae bacterium]|nr:hypothetical protein [Synergistaceae bacterium]
NGDSYEGSWVEGLWNGKGVYTRADGSSFDGDMLNGEPSGKGVYAWPNGNRYEGDWLKGVRSGQGIMKDKEGKILYAGLWKDDKPAGTLKLKTDTVLGIPWGASKKTVESIMSQRPETKYTGKSTRNDAVQYAYTTTFNGNPATAVFCLRQDQMYWVRVTIPGRTAGEATGRYEDFKQGLIHRYGKLIEEKGSGTEALSRWSLGEEHFLTLQMGTSRTGTAPSVPIVILDYIYTPTFDLVEKKGTQKNISDF